MSFLRLDQLGKTYPDGTEAVKGISLDIEEGEFVVLLGPSGCGKTTTLRMLAGLEIPTAGKIEINDLDITDLSASERDVGFVFQFYALYPHMTVAQNIAFPLENMGMPVVEIKKRLVEVADRVGITDMLSRHPGQLSGGDQQRVSLARAMVRRPQMYLMDEPLGTLDADRRLEMREFIREQQIESGVTTIYVTHDQEEAMALADRIVVMRDGSIRQFDTPVEVYESPSEPYVARFVGSPGMNLFEAEILNQGEEATIVAGDASIGVDPSAFASVAKDRIICGIRPEYLYHDDSGSIEGEVVLTEHLGAFSSVYIDTPLGRLVMRAQSDASYEPGEHVRLGYDVNHLKIWPNEDDS